MSSADGVESARVLAPEGLKRVVTKRFPVGGGCSVETGRQVPPAHAHRNELVGRIPTHFLLDDLDTGLGETRRRERVAHRLLVIDRPASGVLIGRGGRGRQPAIDDIVHQPPWPLPSSINTGAGRTPAP